jgi:hypothetical protein
VSSPKAMRRIATFSSAVSCSIGLFKPGLHYCLFAVIPGQLSVRKGEAGKLAPL